MNRYNKELRRKYTEKEIEEMRNRDRHRAWFDGHYFPELFMEMYDSVWDAKDRSNGISSLRKEVRDLIRFRLETGVYPERLHYLALAELRLKHPEE